MAAMAATGAATVIAGVLQPWNHPASARAQDILEGIRAEVASEPVVLTANMLQPTACLPGAMVTVPGPLGASGAAGLQGGLGVRVEAPTQQGNPDGNMFFLQRGPGGPGDRGPGEGPDAMFQVAVPGPGGPLPPGILPPPDANMPNAAELSDRLGQSLGLSGEQVRDAMRQTVSALPRPADPLSQIATQLGVTTDQVREAFSDPACPGRVLIRLNASPSDLAGPAQRLGISPERLASLLVAGTPPTPPNFDEILNRFAQNLGVTPERLRGALDQVEGPNRLYMVAPAPSGPTR